MDLWEELQTMPGLEDAAEDGVPFRPEISLKGMESIGLGITQMEIPTGSVGLPITKPTGADVLEQMGVTEGLYANWLKSQLDAEEACLQLPCTILMLVSSAVLSLFHLRQLEILTVKTAIEFDIMENANFAWENAMGNKGIADVNSWADFWSWARLGFFPLIMQQGWGYAELLDGPSWGYPELPTEVTIPNYKRPPKQYLGDYLHFNRIIGGLRMQQAVVEDLGGDRACRPMSSSWTENEEHLQWLQKPCFPASFGEHTLENPDGVFTEEPTRVHWLLLSDGLDRMTQTLLDMEDGCAKAELEGRGCLCESCAELKQPWLDESILRAELAFVLRACTTER